MEVPKHVAIIMDGNGRWALNRGLKRSLGHLEGSKNLEKLASYIFKSGVKILSVYAFSTENFKRDKEEVNYLMDLFVKVFKTRLNNLKKEKVKIVFSKKETGLREDLEELIKKIELETKDNNEYIFNICINYGGQDEILDMVKKINQMVLNNKITNNEITKELISKNLYQDLEPIDLLIRTSGEYRLSNFMLYQLSYAELYFTDTLFPDFNELEFKKALDWYLSRDRRFGSIKKK